VSDGILLLLILSFETSFLIVPNFKGKILLTFCNKISFFGINLKLLVSILNLLISALLYICLLNYFESVLVEIVDLVDVIRLAIF
jgi:hypothetical protein